VGATDQGWSIEGTTGRILSLVKSAGRPTGVLSIAGSQTGNETRAHCRRRGPPRPSWRSCQWGNDVSVNALDCSKRERLV